MPDLSRKRERERLAIRREPYWQRLAEGAYLGFRRGPDTWLARYRGRDGKQQYQSLSDAPDFDDAKRIAEDWCGQLSGTAVRTIKRDTVRAALEAYVTHLRHLGRAEAATDAEGRFKRFVWNDPLAHVSLETATLDDFEEWRGRVKRGREPRTVNRSVRSLRAALNYANKKAGHIGNPNAWQLSPLRDDIEDAGETPLFLNPVQRRALISAATANAAEFFRGLELTGARPKELADAKVGDFEAGKLRLASRKARSGQIHKIDPLTVAYQTGTSIAMIEKFYYKFIASAMREKLDAVKDSA